MHTLMYYFNDAIWDLGHSLLNAFTFLHMIILVTSQAVQNTMKLKQYVMVGLKL